MEVTRNSAVVPASIAIRGERLCPHGHKRNTACVCYLHPDPAHAPEQCVQQVFLEQSADKVIDLPSH